MFSWLWQRLALKWQKHYCLTALALTHCRPLDVILSEYFHGCSKVTQLWFYFVKNLCFLFPPFCLSLLPCFHFSFSLVWAHGRAAADEDLAQRGGTAACWVNPRVPPSITTCVSWPPTPLFSPITSFDTPKGREGCPWAHGVCSLYTIRGCKLPGYITAKTRTGFGPLSFFLPLSGCNAIKYSCEHKTTLPQQTANWLRVKNTHRQTHTLRHLHTDSAQQQNINEGLICKEWVCLLCVQRLRRETAQLLWLPLPRASIVNLCTLKPILQCKYAISLHNLKQQHAPNEIWRGDGETAAGLKEEERWQD